MNPTYRYWRLTGPKGVLIVRGMDEESPLEAHQGEHLWQPLPDFQTIEHYFSPARNPVKVESITEAEAEASV